jgi:hypothetical protein
VAYPAGFDFTYMYVYMMMFAGESPFSFSALDMKSYASAILAKPYRETTKRNFPKEWIPKHEKHSHVALEDAKEQGYIFMEMLKEAERRKARLEELESMVTKGNELRALLRK